VVYLKEGFVSETNGSSGSFGSHRLKARFPSVVSEGLLKWQTSY